ncbi:MAG: hypothetical protein R3F37_13060 [Candidatus Competibacteraceae bacterium]
MLMPIVASMGGIAGSQTPALVIRGLALSHVEPSNARWLFVQGTDSRFPERTDLVLW